MNKPGIPIGQLAIPSNIAPGTKIWESRDITVTAYCDNVLGSVYDQVWFYFNPLGQSLGPGLQLGVNYLGQDLQANAARLNTNTSPITSGQNVTVTVTFRLYIKVTNDLPPVEIISARIALRYSNWMALVVLTLLRVPKFEIYLVWFKHCTFYSLWCGFSDFSGVTSCEFWFI